MHSPIRRGTVSRLALVMAVLGAMLVVPQTTLDTVSASDLQQTGTTLYLTGLLHRGLTYRKGTSGVHLGSGTFSIWTSAISQRLTGTYSASSTGAFPAVIVVIANNVFRYNYSSTPPCAISSVNGAQMMNADVYNYLKAASQYGSKVIIRLWNPKGNYTDAYGASASHDLLTGLDSVPLLPGGSPASWCSNPSGERDKFRNGRDLANEAFAIHSYAIQDGWTPYAYLLANETNIEWMTANQRQNLGSAWQAIDDYMANVYSVLHSGGQNPTIRILAVPMAQGAFAENLDSNCNPYPGNMYGIGWMAKTWVSGSFSDGWAWNNYWTHGEEVTTSNNSCNSGSGHVFQHFSTSLQNTILASPKPAVISEADLFSSCNPQGTLPNKGENAYSANGAAAAEDLRLFIRFNKSADYIAAWNVGVAYNNTTDCSSGGNNEYAWHEAFRGNGPSGPAESVYERYWFSTWWLNTTEP